MSIQITESELLAAMREAAVVSNAPPSAMTTQQLQIALGLSRCGTQRALAKLRDQGRLEVWTTTRRAASGRMESVPAYTIKPAKTPAKRKR